MAVLESPTQRHHAADLMTREVVTCYADATLEEAARKMRDKDVGFLVVVRRGEHRPLGVLTDRDVCMAAYSQGRRLAEIPAHAAMTPRVQVVRESAGTDEVLTLMSDKKIRRVPVVDDKGELKGVVGLADLARDAASNAAVRKLAETLRQVTHLKMI